MSIQSSVEMNSEVQLHDKSHELVAPLRTNTRSAERARIENKMRSNKSSSLTTQRPKLGEAVRHSLYGDGQLLALWPDGTLLVKFDSGAKSRTIWPSFLDRTNG